MNIKTPQITESVSELKNLIRKTSTGYQKQRLTMLYLYRSGQTKTRKQAAEMIGVHRKTVGEWLATYASGGLDALWLMSKMSVDGNLTLVVIAFIKAIALKSYISQPRLLFECFFDVFSPLNL